MVRILIEQGHKYGDAGECGVKPYLIQIGNVGRPYRVAVNNEPRKQYAS